MRPQTTLISLESFVPKRLEALRISPASTCDVVSSYQDRKCFGFHGGDECVSFPFSNQVKKKRTNLLVRCTNTAAAETTLQPKTGPDEPTRGRTLNALPADPTRKQDTRRSQ